MKRWDLVIAVKTYCTLMSIMVLRSECCNLIHHLLDFSSSPMLLIRWHRQWPYNVYICLKIWCTYLKRTLEVSGVFFSRHSAIVTLNVYIERFGFTWQRRITTATADFAHYLFWKCLKVVFHWVVQVALRCRKVSAFSCFPVKNRKIRNTVAVGLGLEESRC